MLEYIENVLSTYGYMEIEVVREYNRERNHIHMLLKNEKYIISKEIEILKSRT